jgi:hypothetical protein
MAGVLADLSEEGYSSVVIVHERELAEGVDVVRASQSAGD